MLYLSRIFRFVGPGKKKISTPVAPNNISSQALQPLKRHGSDDQAVSQAGLAPHGSTGSFGEMSGDVHIGGPTTTRLECDLPYRWGKVVNSNPYAVVPSFLCCPTPYARHYWYLYYFIPFSGKLTSCSTSLSTQAKISAVHLPNARVNQYFVFISTFPTPSPPMGTFP